MANPVPYCSVISRHEKSPIASCMRNTSDNEYGFPLDNDDALFGRLILEINQAGLSWTTILEEKDNFFKAYHGFDIRKVAAQRKRY